MIIRPARKSDVDVVPELMLQAMEEIIFTFIGKNDIEEAIQFLSKLFTERNNQYSFENTFVTEDTEENIIGILTAYNGDQLEKLRAPVLSYMKNQYNVSIQPENETEGNEYYLDVVSISPSNQGKGIGSLLLKHGIKFAKKNGYSQVGLLVDLENPSAQRLYERLGFQIGKQITLVGGEYYHMHINL